MNIRRAILAVALVLLAGIGFVVGRASADQPHMQAALDHLKAARTELEAAEADKGGHRVKALTLTKDAIEQVERGIEYDRHHE
jgi:hypothetical protein